MMISSHFLFGLYDNFLLALTSVLDYHVRYINSPKAPSLGNGEGILSLQNH